MADPDPRAPAEPIDAVVTWVDGNDPRHRAKLDRYLKSIGHRPATAAPTRFHSVGEIDYCLTSLLRFAPFLRRIHIVTDEQVPPLVERARDWAPALRDKLVIVDHREIFAGHGDCLPTFNSRSIETMLHRIPDLAEHHVYFNDDFLLVKPVAPGEWFRGGWPVVRGRWSVPQDREIGQRLRRILRRVLNRPKPPRPLHQRSQALSAALVGYGRRYFSTHHVPHPMRRSTLQRFFGERPDLLHANIRPRLRDISQFAPPALAHHLEIRSGTVHLEERPRRVYLEPAALSPSALAAALAQAELDPDVVCACIQSLDEATPQCLQQTLAWLDRLVGRDGPAAA
jgi:hypothetical protein